MKNINDTDAPFRGCLVMMQDRWGFWHFTHYPERKPLTTKELELLHKSSTNQWILVGYPTQPMTDEEHNSLRVNQHEKR